MKKLLIAALLIVAVAVCFAEPVAVNNPGFEMDEDGDRIPDGWNDFMSGEGFEIALSTEVQHSGAQSVRITGLPDHHKRASVGQTTDQLELKPAYRLSYFVKGEGNPTGLLRFRFNPPDGPEDNETFHFRVDDFNTEEWTEFSVTIGTPEEILAVGTASIEFILYQRGTGDIYFDDVSLEALDEYTPPEEPDTAGAPDTAQAGPTDTPTLTNPDFEINEDDNPRLPDGWREAIHGEDFEIALSDQYASSGERAIRITGGPEHGSRACVLQTTPPFRVGRAYRLIFDARGEGNGTVTFRFRYYMDEDGEEQDDSQYVNVGPVSSDQWTEKTYDFVPAPEVAEAGVARLELILYQKGEGDLYYDNLRIEEIDTPLVPLRNASFEVDQDGDNLPDNWRTFASGEGFEFARSDAYAHSGQFSGCITGLPDHADRACWGQTTDSVPVDKAFRLTFWIRGEGRANGIFRYRYTDADGEGADHTERFGIDEISADEWREKTYEFGVPNDIQQVGHTKIELLLYQRGTGDLYYDDVEIAALSEWAPKMSAGEQALQAPRKPHNTKAVLQNPPDFQWQPQPAAHTYELQLSTSPDFSEDATATVSDLPYNCYSHSAVLTDEEWYWRYRMVTDAGEPSNWSEVWSFTISPDAVEFPVPPPAELLASIPQGHPRIYVTAEMLEEFRAPRTGDKTEWWETFQPRLDNYLDTPLPEEPGPQYDFSDRSGPLSAEDYALKNELRSLGGQATSPMWNLAFGYLVSGDEKYGNRAVEWLMEISTWDPEGTTGYRNHDQVFRDIAWRSASAYDWLYEIMTPQQRETALNAVAARGAILYHDFSEDSRPIYEWPFDSHGQTSLGLLGIISIGLAHDYTPANDWFKFVSGTYIAQYPPWGGEEGGWCQGVGYWKWSVRYSAMFFDALSSATGVDMFDKAFCRNNGWYKIYMHPPWCDRHHFGDGNQGSPGGTDRNNLMLYATRYENPYYKWYAEQIPGGRQTDAFAYWWYDYDLPSKPPVDVPQSRYQPDIGWVGMHSDLSDPDEIMLMFKSSWYGSFNHSHADQNHFVVYGYGEPLLIDSGYYDWYGSDHDRNWTRQTKAHNDILVNGEGQPIFDITAKGDILDYFAAPAGCYTAGDATPAYRGNLSNFVRRIVYLRPDVFLVVDELEADERSDWTWCCHALSEMQLDEAGRRVTITEGDAHLDIAFAAPTDLTMTQDNDWDGHPPQGRFSERPKNWHAYIKTANQTETERFVTLMNVRKGGQEPEFESRETPQGNGIEGTLGDLSVVVRTVGEEPVTLLGGSVDADIAAISNTDGAFKAFALNATHIDHPDLEMPIFTATEPVTVTLWVADTGLRSAKVRADAPAEVTLMLPGGEQTLLMDGAELDDAECTWDGNAVTLPVKAGEHTIIPQAMAFDGGGDLELLIDGEPAEMNTRQLTKYTGGALVHGNFEVEDGVYSIDREHPPVPGITINGTAIHPDDPFVWLNQNNSIQASLDTTRSVMMGLKSMPCAPEPHVTKVVEDLPENAMKIEAESFDDSGLGNPNRYTHRTFLSGGVGVGAWESPGMWMEWNITPPEPGEYHLVIKGATHLPHADRLIMLNDEPIGEQFRRFRFEYTDGYGATPEEWREMMVVDHNGDPIPLTLHEGSNTLRMIAIADLLNLDYLMLVPAD